MRTLHSPAQAASWLAGRVRGSLHCDSRRLRAGDGFVAWPGAATDGRRFVGAALAQGASACLVEADGAADFGLPESDEALAAYAGLKAATGPIAAIYHGDPSRALQVLAITGTNGKTSTAWWLAQALTRAGRRCGVIGTLGVGHPPALQATGLTTPDPVLLQRSLRSFADDGAQAVAIEASSIGIAERRLDGTAIEVAVFTNFSQDHLDYHGNMSAYWAAKAELFAWPGLRAAVVNIDDAQGQALADALTTQGHVELWTVSRESQARLRASAIDWAPQGLDFSVAEAGGAPLRLRTRMVGLYNVSNLLGVLGTLRALGLPLAQAVDACADLLAVPGRMEQVSTASDAAAPLVVVDYAHTPDALEQALAALQPLASQRGGQLWCVFGCGGERDSTKRPLMAAVAELRASRVVVTSDNPRDEKPEAIISQMLLGLSHSDAVQVQADRAQAIAQTIAQAAPQDVVLLAGKGHEEHQEIAGVKHPFSDVAHARRALERRSLAPIPLPLGEGAGSPGSSASWGAGSGEGSA